MIWGIIKYSRPVIRFRLKSNKGRCFVFLNKYPSTAFTLVYLFTHVGVMPEKQITHHAAVAQVPRIGLIKIFVDPFLFFTILYRVCKCVYNIIQPVEQRLQGSIGNNISFIL